MSSDILSLITEINEYIKNLSEVNLVLMNDCKTTHFEYVCLATPNLLTRISVAIDQIEIKYLEEQVLEKPDNKILKDKLNDARKKFEEIAKYAGLTD